MLTLWEKAKKNQDKKGKTKPKSKPAKSNSSQVPPNISTVVTQPGITQPTSSNNSSQVPPNYIPVVPQPMGNQQAAYISSPIPANYIPVVPQPGTTIQNTSPQQYKRYSARIKAKKKL